jgi:DNA polymerase-1
VGVNSIKIPGYEADDLMYSVAKEATSVNKHVMIVTSDKDMLQLVSDNVSIYSPFKDKVISPLNFYEETGVTIESYLGYRALIGDKSDNIIGIEGIAEGKAKKLMDEYGHIDNILNAQGLTKQKLLKSKVFSRIFTSEGLQKLATNNKIMNLRLAPESRAVNDLVYLAVHDSEIEVNSKEFKAWLMRWQFVSILANYLPWVTPFLALGDDE